MMKKGQKKEYPEVNRTRRSSGKLVETTISYASCISIKSCRVYVHVRIQVNVNKYTCRGDRAGGASCTKPLPYQTPVGAVTIIFAIANHLIKLNGNKCAYVLQLHCESTKKRWLYMKPRREKRASGGRERERRKR